MPRLPATPPVHETADLPQIFLLSCLAGWLNREQQKVLDYLREETRVLKEHLGGRRLRVTDDQRRRLAIKDKEIGRRLLFEAATIVTPDTILRWHRRMIARKWSNGAGTGRPGLMKEIADLCVRMATENPTWGYRRIKGALKNIGHRVAHNTVKKALNDAGIEPAPDRSKTTTWSQFMKTQWDTLAATDFFTTEVWTVEGIVTFYTLFVIDIRSRRVHVVGSTPRPDRVFMAQAALDLAAFDDGFLRGATHLIMDRDSKFTDEFREKLKDNGVNSVRIPPRSPNCNPHAERWVRSIKSECLDRLVCSVSPRSTERSPRSSRTITRSATTRAWTTSSSSLASTPPRRMAPSSAVIAWAGCSASATAPPHRRSPFTDPANPRHRSVTNVVRRGSGRDSAEIEAKKEGASHSRVGSGG